MTVTLNRRAFDHAKVLIGDGEVVFDDRDTWSERRPSAEEENELWLCGVRQNLSRLAIQRPELLKR